MPATLGLPFGFCAERMKIGWSLLWTGPETAGGCLRVPSVRRMYRPVAAASLLVLVLVVSPSAASAAAKAPRPTETLTAFKAQAARGAVRSVKVNRKSHDLRATLRAGGHAVVSFPSREATSLVAQLKAEHVRVTERRRTHKRKHRPAHKLRYIAAGVLVVAVVVSGALLALRRRRRGTAPA